MNTIFLKVPTVADTLKISKALAYRLVSEGQIESVRFGRTVRVSEDSLKEFIERNKSSSEDRYPTVRSSRRIT